MAKIAQFDAVMIPGGGNDFVLEGVEVFDPHSCRAQCTVNEPCPEGCQSVLVADAVFYKGINFNGSVWKVFFAYSGSEELPCKVTVFEG